MYSFVVYSTRFSRPITVTDHCRRRMSERSGSDQILVDLVETGEVRHKDDILEIHFSDKSIVREVSQEWNVNLSLPATVPWSKSSFSMQ